MFPYDIYMFTNSRQKETVNAFIAGYTADMEEAAADYHVPQYSDPKTGNYYALPTLIDTVLANPNMEYSVYFTSRKPSGPIRSSMLFFTADACLIVGLTVACEENQLGGYLQRLADCVAGECGYATVETPPPLTKAEFLAESKRSPFPVFRRVV